VAWLLHGGGMCVAYFGNLFADDLYRRIERMGILLTRFSQ
jgi:hypothetical protein